jgi:DNA-binding transcriptional MerR regulator
MSRRHSGSPSSAGDAPSYSLDELTSLTGVTVRTVRYYIAEGLLPPPVTVGRNASYTREHLDRLRLITRLKEGYLPLKEIRRQIQAMSPEEIASAVGDEASDQSSASRYIARAMEESTPQGYQTAAPPQRWAVASRTPTPKQQAWRRIRISDEAELLITTSAHLRRSGQLEAAIDWIRCILNES